MFWEMKAYVQGMVSQPGHGIAACQSDDSVTKLSTKKSADYTKALPERLEGT